MTIFVVQIGEEKQRLIDAASKKAAVQFALPVVVQAEKADASTVAQLMANGTRVESTRAE